MVVMRRSLLQLALALMLTAGCAQKSEPEQPQRLADVQVPGGFKMSNTQTVAVTVEVDPAAVPAGESAGLDVATSDGQTLYRGPAPVGGPLQLKLALPVVQRSLIATLTLAQATHTAEGSIDAGAVALHFK